MLLDSTLLKNLFWLYCWNAQYRIANKDYRIQIKANIWLGSSQTAATGAGGDEGFTVDCKVQEERKKSHFGGSCLGFTWSLYTRPMASLGNSSARSPIKGIAPICKAEKLFKNKDFWQYSWCSMRQYKRLMFFNDLKKPKKLQEREKKAKLK